MAVLQKDYFTYNIPHMNTETKKVISSVALLFLGFIGGAKTIHEVSTFLNPPKGTDQRVSLEDLLGVVVGGGLSISSFWLGGVIARTKNEDFDPSPTDIET
jgi:hypothetical protein